MKKICYKYPYRCLCCGEPIGGGDSCPDCYQKRETGKIKDERL